MVISQERGGLLIWDVGEAAAHQPPVPGVQGGPHAVAALVAQLLLALDPVHHVEAVTAWWQLSDSLPGQMLDVLLRGLASNILSPVILTSISFDVPTDHSSGEADNLWQSDLFKMSL